MKAQRKKTAGRKMVESDSLFAFARPQPPKPKQLASEVARLESAERSDLKFSDKQEDDKSKSSSENEEEEEEESGKEQRQRFDSDDEAESQPQKGVDLGNEIRGEETVEENRVRKNRAFLEQIKRAMGDPVVGRSNKVEEAKLIEEEAVPQIAQSKNNLNFYPGENSSQQKVGLEAKIFGENFQGQKLFEKPKSEQKTLEEEHQKLLLINGRRVC